MSINYTGSGGGIPRKTAKIFAENSDTNDMTVFGSTLANNTTYSKDLDSIQSSAYETGWRDAVISNLNYPLLSDMNGVQHVLSQQIAYILQHGCPEWNAGTTYYAYDLVASGGIIYTSLIDENTNNSVTDDTKWAVYYNPAYFLNKRQITNCILEAPNGVATYSGNTVTVKAGLKVLIPNGRNADGTLDNIEYTLPEDISYTLLSTPSKSYYLNLGLSSSYNPVINMQVQDDYYVVDNLSNAPTPVSTRYWWVYVEEENKTYVSIQGADYIPYYFAKIGYLYTNGTSITGIKTNDTIDILKRTDKDEMSGWGAPSYTYSALSIGAPGATYTMPANGWLQITGTATATYGWVRFDNTRSYGNVNYGPYAGAPVWITACVFKGEEITVSYDGVNMEIEIGRASCRERV